jgi:hypothetical protein
LLAPKPGGTNRARVAHREVPASCGVLEAGEGLARGESLASCDGQVTLTMGDRHRRPRLITRRIA